MPRPVPKPSVVVPFPTPSQPRSRQRAADLALIRAWLWLVAGCILLMVVVGGATRLTQSGLSITEWKPIMGIVPPLTADAWQAEFDRYKIIPQYAKVFPDMDVAGFKAIFYWEWAHRLLGRVIALVVAVPLAGFWIAGRLPRPLKPKLLGLFALGGLQGVIGWWMVRSGLSHRVEVSQYFLALHLVTASLTFAWALWLAEGLRPKSPPRRLPPRFRATATLLLCLILLQIGLGAFVAGLHAGLTYNTWPLMDGRFVPPLADLLRQSPAWSNLFENVAAVQFDHRLIAYAVLATAWVHATDAWRRVPGSGAARGATLILAACTVQVGIGITTLLLVVPLWAALLHQAFAMVVLATAVVHRRGLAGSRPRPAAVQSPPAVARA